MVTEMWSPLFLASNRNALPFCQMCSSLIETTRFSDSKRNHSISFLCLLLLFFYKTFYILPCPVFFLFLFVTVQQKITFFFQMRNNNNISKKSLFLFLCYNPAFWKRSIWSSKKAWQKNKTPTAVSETKCVCFCLTFSFSEILFLSSKHRKNPGTLHQKEVSQLLKKSISFFRFSNCSISFFLCVFLLTF